MNPYYVYALKDPRSSPARPFYVGKGTGNRAWEHSVRVDSTPEGKRIGEIHAAGLSIITAVLADDLTEHQALKLESELIAAFGTEATGGLLTNAVVPSGKAAKVVTGVSVPAGIVEKAQIGLALLQSAVLELAQANEKGVTNAEVAKTLGLQSDYAGGSKDYLSWSLIGLLMRDGKLVRDPSNRRHRAVVK